MKYQLSTNFTKLNEKSGVLENQSTYATVEFSTSQSVPPAGTGVYIAPGTKYRFSLADSDGYVRFTAVRQGDAQREISVVHDVSGVCRGSSGGASGTNGREVELAIDAQYIKWRYRDDSVWHNLIAIDDLKGSFDPGMSFSELHTLAKTVIDAINELHDTYLPLSGGTMTGAIVQPLEPSINEHLANKAYVDATIAALVDGAPGGLDTLNKLAAALAADSGMSTTLLTLIGDKLDKTEAVTTAVAGKLLRLDSVGKLPASITGNAATAVKLQSPVKINGVLFYGDNDINIAADAKVDDWQTGTMYSKHGLVVQAGQLWRAQRPHVSQTNFSSDMTVGNEMWELIASSGGSGGTGGYAQVTKIGVTASAASPKVEDILINNTTTFCKPPVDVLKFTLGTQDVVTTVCAFDNADADDFMAGGKSGEEADCVEFDGQMRPRTAYDVPVGAPTALGSGFISESDEIDFADYKKVEEVM